MLDQLGRNLNRLAEAGELEQAVGRSEELAQLCNILSLDGKNSAVLVGPPGVGKTAIVEGLAVQLARGEVPKALKGKEIVELNFTGLVSGTMYRGQLEEKLNKLMAELKRHRHLILFIDEIHTIMGQNSSGSGADDLAQVLKPALARGEIAVIGATTTEEYRRYVEPDGAFARRLGRVEVGPLSREATLAVISGLARRYEREYGVVVDADALGFLVDASVQYLPDRNLPDKAIDLLRQLFGSAGRERAGEGRSRTLESHFMRIAEELTAIKERDYAAALRHLDGYVNARRSDGFRTLGKADVARLISQKTGVPVSAGMGDDFRDRILGLKEALRAHVRGQDAAVAAIAAAMTRMAAGMKRPEKPAGSFLFVGPTGVGKTELARRLAEHLFGSKDRVIRIDMSEYMDEFSVTRLIGSPPGYAGHEAGGQLTEAVHRQPYSVVLLDEVEKAHPQVQNLFLQMLEEGVLTDGKGRQSRFNQTVIILTSNEGAELFTQFTSEQLAGDRPAITELVRGRLMHRFRPEVLNRLDEIVLFAPLAERELLDIFDLVAADYASMVQTSHGLSLQFTETVRLQLVRQAFDPLMGARPLRRTLEALVITPLSDALLRQRFKAGQTVRVDWDQEVVFHGA